MDNETKCKGAWLADDEDAEGLQEAEVICPLRKTCFRYQARYQIPMVVYYDVPPFSINMRDCPVYIPWSSPRYGRLV